MMLAINSVGLQHMNFSYGKQLDARLTEKSENRKIGEKNKDKRKERRN
jgi:hypothetical protein